MIQKLSHSDAGSDLRDNYRLEGVARPALPQALALSHPAKAAQTVMMMFTTRPTMLPIGMLRTAYQVLKVPCELLDQAPSQYRCAAEAEIQDCARLCEVAKEQRRGNRDQQKGECVKDRRDGGDR
jgi:hypothetical protein